MNITIKLGFFINDLRRQIQQLHKDQLRNRIPHNSFQVFRGQGMSNADFEQMIRKKGGLLAFNSFLSTSRDRELAQLLAESNTSNPDLKGILFVMTIDPSKPTALFAFIKEFSHFSDEDGVLFDMQAVFRIDDIKPMTTNSRLFQVELTLTSDKDKDLHQLTDHIRQETFVNSRGWSRLGVVLYKMDHFNKAEEIYQILLQQTADESEMAPIYGQLGSIKQEQGQYEEAITFYGIAVEINKKNLPSNNLSLATAYNNIANAYYRMSQCPKALSYYEKALEIQQELSSNHPNLARSYSKLR